MSRKEKRGGKKNRKRAPARSQSKTGLYVALPLLAFALLVVGGWVLNRRQWWYEGTKATMRAQTPRGTS